jgi:hypothetical protein
MTNRKPQGMKITFTEGKTTPNRKDSISERWSVWSRKWWGDMVTDVALKILDFMVLGVYIAAAKFAISAIWMLGTTSWLQTIVFISKSCTELNTCDNIDWWAFEFVGNINIIGLFVISMFVWYHIIMDGIKTIKYLKGEKNGQGTKGCGCKHGN